MNATTLTWTSRSGKTLEARIEYSATYYASQPIDGGWGGHTSASCREDITVTLSVDGNVVGTQNGLPMQYVPGYHRDIPATCTVVFALTTLDGNHLQVATGGITIDDFNVAVAALRAANAPEEGRCMIDAEQAASAQSQRDEAEAILACTRVFADDAELAAWRRDYNNGHNEGGEGYVPPAVTRAQQDWARGIFA